MADGGRQAPERCSSAVCRSSARQAHLRDVKAILIGGEERQEPTPAGGSAAVQRSGNANEGAGACRAVQGVPQQPQLLLVVAGSHPLASREPVPGLIRPSVLS